MKAQGITVPVVAAAALFFMLCAPLPGRCDEGAFTFIVLGNTLPESPFTGFTDSLPEVFSSVTAQNPLFVVHTGNMVYGGSGSAGIEKGDLVRQFLLFKKAAHGLPVPLYTIAGEKDLFDSESKIYEEQMKRPRNYSFNTGRTHVICFNSIVAENDHTAQQKNLSWLRKDLKNSRKAALILVFTHYCPFTARGDDYFSWSSKAHGLFSKQGVFAVISGNEKDFYSLKKDGVRYVNAGCGGFSTGDRCRRCSHYHIAVYNGEDLSFTGKKIALDGQR